MTQASRTAVQKVGVAVRQEPLRRWPLLWTVSFSLLVSGLLWVGIIWSVGFVLELVSPPA